MIEFLFWRDCPSHERALAMLREVMDELGLDASELRVIEVLSDDDAERLGFPGSPTIRVDGVDVQEPDDQLGGRPGSGPSSGPSGSLGNLTCRLYRKRDGRISPLPDEHDVREALDRAYGAGGTHGASPG